MANSAHKPLAHKKLTPVAYVIGIAALGSFGAGWFPQMITPDYKAYSFGVALICLTISFVLALLIVRIAEDRPTKRRLLVRAILTFYFLLLIVSLCVKYLHVGSWNPFVFKYRFSVSCISLMGGVQRYGLVEIPYDSENPIEEFKKVVKEKKYYIPTWPMVYTTIPEIALTIINLSKTEIENNDVFVNANIPLHCVMADCKKAGVMSNQLHFSNLKLIPFNKHVGFTLKIGIPEKIENSAVTIEVAIEGQDIQSYRGLGSFWVYEERKNVRR